jgi:hypothetical protein
MGCDDVKCSKYKPVFRWNLLSPSSGGGSVKFEAAILPKSVSTYQTTLRHNLEDRNNQISSELPVIRKFKVQMNQNLIQYTLNDCYRASESQMFQFNWQGV